MGRDLFDLFPQLQQTTIERSNGPKRMTTMESTGTPECI